MKKTFIYATIIAIIASFFIFFQFNEIPKGLANDEVDFIHLALNLNGQSYQPYTPEATGHTTLYFYVILFFFKVFGITQFGLRFASAASGVVAAVLFYFVAKEAFKEKHIQFSLPKIGLFKLEFAFIAALTLLSMRWYFQFARFSFEATFLLMFELVALYAVLLFRRSQSIFYVILAALASGLAYNSYTPGRLFFILIAGLIFYISKKKKQHLSVFIGVFFLCIAPLTLYFLQHQDVRIEQQLYLKNPDLTILEKVGFFIQNAWKNFYMLFGEGDVNGRHNYPYKNALNPILYSFLGLGIVHFFKLKKTFFDKLFFAYLIIGTMPTLLTYPHENPNMLRTFTVLPAFAYFITRGFLWVFEQVKKDKKKIHLVSIIILFLLLVSMIYEARAYFIFQKLVYIQAFDLMNVFENLAK
jgi:4-amino-4-deoxy-L-arabinose transferase-like glycosyltransferase